MEKGCLIYKTPDGTFCFPEGSAGLVNANVLHRAGMDQNSSCIIQKILIFSPTFISSKENRIYRDYVNPILTSGCELFCFSGKQLDLVHRSFSLFDEDCGYEILLRNLLSEILLECYKMLSEPLSFRHADAADHKLLRMIAFIEEHISEKITVTDVASSVYISDRDCYRRFQKELKETPLQFIQSVRLEKACQLLSQTDLPVSEITCLCGFRDSSYFSSFFSGKMGCTPGSYRRMAHEQKSDFSDYLPK